MNCPYCSTENGDHAKFCKQCGAQLAIFPAYQSDTNSKAINLFVAYLSIYAAQSISWLIINKWVMADKDYLSDKWKKVMMVENVVGLLTSLASLIILFMLCNVVKQRTAKTVLICITIADVIFFFVYQILPILQRESFLFK